MNDPNPFHAADKNYNINLVKSLSDRRTAINTKDLNGKTALHWAVSNGCSEMVRTLLNHGGDPTVVDNEGNSPLHHACKRYINLVKILVEENSSVVDFQNSEGQTPLHIAVSNFYRCDLEQIDALRMLLSNGAQVNMPDHSGRSSLHMLVLNRFCPELCALLLNEGGNILQQDEEGKTPLHLAITTQPQYVRFFTTDTVVVSIPDYSGNYPIHTAVMKRDSRIVKLLLDNGESVDSKNRMKETALHLHLMARRRSKLIFKLLIDRGAPVNGRDICMRTPLHIAAHNRSLSLHSEIRILLARGALPNSKDENGMTPLHYAVKTSHLKPVRILLRNGAQVNIQDENGQTPLMAVGRNNRILELLLENGADVNVQDEWGQTALHLIASKHQDRLFVNPNVNQRVEMLLDWGASPSLKDRSGKSVLYYTTFRIAKTMHDTKMACLEVFHIKTNGLLWEWCHHEEVKKMKEFKIGNNTLFDVFRQFNDPWFLSNKELESTIQFLKDEIPIYASLLKTYHKKAKIRVKLFKAVADIIQSPLPIDVFRYILTFVDDNSLNNVVKAKEESV